MSIDKGKKWHPNLSRSKVGFGVVHLGVNFFGGRVGSRTQGKIIVLRMSCRIKKSTALV